MDNETESKAWERGYKRALEIVREEVESHSQIDSNEAVLKSYYEACFDILRAIDHLLEDCE